MSNTKMMYCPTCERMRPFYNEDWGSWICDECGTYYNEEDDTFEEDEEE